jgi:glycosyltransferase involved in cell wall biosynthesis
VAPRVSVCIPVYNGARVVTESITSVLHQTFEDFELVVVDNASSDGTPEVIQAFEDPRIRFVQNPSNIGAEPNWNRALSLTEGEFVKLLCADDILRPECLAQQVEILTRHPEVAFVAGQRHVIDEEQRILLASRGLAGLRDISDGPTATRAAVRAGTNIFGEPACVLMRRDQIERCGPFSARYPYMIDLDYWCRLARFGSVFAQRSTVAAFRVSLGSWSVDLARRQGQQATAFFQELHRRDPRTVRIVDVCIGAARATALAGARGVSYRILERAARRPPRPGRRSAGLPALHHGEGW